MHGVIMIFFFLVPSVPATLGNFLIPLMLGAKDLALPKINLLSWYLYIAGGIMAIYTMATGGVDTGWTFTTPLSTHYRQHQRAHHRPGGLHRRLQLHLYRAELHRHHPQDALPGHDLVPHAAVCVGALCGQHPHGAGHASAGHRHRPRGSRAHHRNRRLRSNQGRRSAALPTFVLVLLAPRRLHHDSAGHGRDLRSRFPPSAASASSATRRLRSPRWPLRCSASLSGRTTCSSWASQTTRCWCFRC